MITVVCFSAAIIILVIFGLIPLLFLIIKSLGFIPLPWEAAYSPGGISWIALLRSGLFAAVASAFQLLAALLAGRFLFATKSLQWIITCWGALLLTLPPMAVALLWRVVLTSGGPLNHFLDLLGIPSPKWLSTLSPLHSAGFSELNWAHFTVFLVEFWVWVPFIIAIIIIAASHIPRDIIDNALIDGASYGQLYRKVVIPWIFAPLAWVWLLRFVDSFRVYDAYWIIFKSQIDIRPFSIEVFIKGVQTYHFQEAAILSLLGLVTAIFAAWLVWGLTKWKGQGV